LSRCARRGRRSRHGPPQPAWLRRNAAGGIEVELVGNEDGVSPGQACAFYDAADGQPRVLGGGMIAATIAMRQSATDVAMAAAR
jgi:tRNA-uridine 2-sulfurtransferase